MFHHCFIPNLHPINGVPETIIHPEKYHAQVHGFVDSSQMKVMIV
jgi:hypothetical protein